MEAWSEVGPMSNLILNGIKKRKREEKKNHIFSPHFGQFWTMGIVRERNERNSSFSLRYMEIGWSESIE